MRGLMRRGLPQALAVAAIRLTRCPVIQFRVGHSVSRPLERTRSALTCSSISSSLARICIEDALILAQSAFKGVFKVSESLSLDAMAWSDNPITFADCSVNAVHNFKCWAFFLKHEFNMHIKPDSKLVIPARTKQRGVGSVEVGGEVWEERDNTLLLGSWLTATGDDLLERNALYVSFNRAFWKHARSLCNSRAPLASRLRFWKRLAFGLADFRLAGIAPGKRKGEAMETYLNSFIKQII